VVINWERHQGDLLVLIPDRHDWRQLHGALMPGPTQTMCEETILIDGCSVCTYDAYTTGLLIGCDFVSPRYSIELINPQDLIAPLNSKSHDPFQTCSFLTKSCTILRATKRRLINAMIRRQLSLLVGGKQTVMGQNNVKAPKYDSFVAIH
jgi:hypothetical protein